MQNSSAIPDISTLYRLPFSKNDNPNGWVEITTDCNLRCPGCYRGCNRDDNIALHVPLEQVMANVLEMKRIRNCQIISLSGGEPLLHPDLESIVRFIRDNQMFPFVHTNGLLLTPELITRLKRAGLAGLIIRVDSLSRNRATTEEALNSVRQKYGEMVNAIGGIHLTFLCVVNKENIGEINSVVKWSITNAKLVDFITFIPMRQVLFQKTDVIDSSKWIYLQDLCEQIQSVIPDIRYASYLGSKVENTAMKWLQSPWIVMNNRILGYAGPKFVESFQMFHHLFKGKYAYKFGQGRSYLNFFQILIISVFLSDFRGVARSFFKEIISNPLNLFQRATVQLLCYIIPPGLVDGMRDECDGCPDAILYNGKLVPSCGLEEYKLFENQTDNIQKDDSYR
ncbi:MAG: radical SAM protein [Bacteroidota bacterium]|nr:radical SAM protein [Bacteroidota bacterium]